uniref:Ubiquitin-like protease family profile domain-containing protein n=1 Tax=Bracon brevicornis TaxID=1563983 RepID=A0A6V7IS39_9HYME
MQQIDETILSYYDVLIRRSDLETLDDRSWLNDTIIGFYFDYLERTRATKLSSTKVVLVSPELTQLMKMTEPEDYISIIGDRIKRDTDFIFFPLNNSEERMDMGGSHWSLLIYSKTEFACFHFDSSCNANAEIAAKFSMKIFAFLGVARAYVRSVHCPQQVNSYDCGIYVLTFAEIILSNLKTVKKIEGCNLDAAERRASTKRRDIRELIRILRSSPAQAVASSMTIAAAAATAAVAGAAAAVTTAATQTSPTSPQAEPPSRNYLGILVANFLRRPSK